MGFPQLCRKKKKNFWLPKMTSQKVKIGKMRNEQMATIIVIYQQCGIYDGSGTIIIFFNVCGPHCAEWALHLTQNGPILARVQRGIPNTPKARKKTRRTSAWALPRRCGALRPRSYTLRSKISSRVSLSISSGFFVLPSPFPFLSMDSIPCASFSHLMI